MYATRLLPIFTTPRIESLNHDKRLPVLIVLGLFVCNELRVTGGGATLDHLTPPDSSSAADRQRKVEVSAVKKNRGDGLRFFIGLWMKPFININKISRQGTRFRRRS